MKNNNDPIFTKQQIKERVELISKKIDVSKLTRNKKRVFTNRAMNPRDFLYRFTDNQQIKAIWSKEEEELFLKKISLFDGNPIWQGWGIFSMHFTSKHGIQCGTFYKNKKLKISLITPRKKKKKKKKKKKGGIKRKRKRRDSSERKIKKIKLNTPMIPLKKRILNCHECNEDLSETPPNFIETCFRCKRHVCAGCWLYCKQCEEYYCKKCKCNC